MNTPHRHREHAPRQNATAIPRKEEPAHRHSAPTGPWPFLNLRDPVDESFVPAYLSPVMDTFAHRRTGSLGGQVLRMREERPQTPENTAEDAAPSPWAAYPMSHFPNWKPAQQARSGIAKRKKIRHPTTLYCADVLTSGQFIMRDQVKLHPQESSEEDFWTSLTAVRPKDTVLRAYFVEDLSGPAMQMLGARFTIEPFFFSSFLNWIPSRHFQDEPDPEDLRETSKPAPSQGQHITFTLSFVRSIRKQDAGVHVGKRKKSKSNLHSSAEQAIDIQEALTLESQERILVHDFMAMHLIKVRPQGGLAKQETSTLISLHPDADHRATTAPHLHGRFIGVGRSVYWSNMLAGNASLSTTKLPGDISPSLPPVALPNDRISQSQSSPSNLRRRNSGTSTHARKNSNEFSHRRRGSRSDSFGASGLSASGLSTSHGLGLFEIGTLAHRRQNSVGSLSLPSTSQRGWLTGVEEHAVEDEDEDDELSHLRGLSGSPTGDGLGTPPHTPSDHSESHGQHLVLSSKSVPGRLSPLGTRFPQSSSPNVTPSKEYSGSPGRFFGQPGRSSPAEFSDSPPIGGDSSLKADSAPGINVTASENAAPKMTSDPALVMFGMLWHAVYCWDEAFDHLVAHISILEGETLKLTSGEMDIDDPEEISAMHTKQSQELFGIQAHLLHYASLLADFRKTINFIEGTALGTKGESLSYARRMRRHKREDSTGFGAGGRMKERQNTYQNFGGDADDQSQKPFKYEDNPEELDESPFLDDAEDPGSRATPASRAEQIEEKNKRRVVRSEAAKMADEIERMERLRGGLENRLKNLMDLAYARINIEDSRAMQRLTEASLKDSAAMKQISYLSMFFLPATFVATLFGMNIDNLKPGTAGTVAHYAETAIPLSVVTIWLIVAMQFAYSKRYRSRRSTDGHIIAEPRRRDMLYDVWGSLSWPFILIQRGLRTLNPNGRVNSAMDMMETMRQRRKHKNEYRAENGIS